MFQSTILPAGFANAFRLDYTHILADWYFYVDMFFRSFFMLLLRIKRLKLQAYGGYRKRCLLVQTYKMQKMIKIYLLPPPRTN